MAEHVCSDSYGAPLIQIEAEGDNIGVEDLGDDLRVEWMLNDMTDDADKTVGKCHCCNRDVAVYWTASFPDYLNISVRCEQCVIVAVDHVAR